MPYTLDEHSTPVRFTLNGDCVVDNAREVHAALAKALSEHDHIALDLNGVEYADITFVQLLLATLQAARAEGKRLELTAPISAAARSALQVSGVDCDDAVDAFLSQTKQATCGLAED